jgi:hypothetical protein
MDNNTSDRRRVFMRLPEKDKFETLFEMVTYQAANRVAERAQDITRIQEVEDTQKYMQGELEGIARRKTDTLELNTTDKMNAIVDKREAGFVWFRDKVLAPWLSYILTLITAALVYVIATVIATGKLP